MMLDLNSKIKSVSGKSYRIEKFLAKGGQAETYLASELNSKSKGVAKVFHSDYNDKQTRERIDYLLNQEFIKLFATPTEKFDSKAMIGHFSPFVGDHSLEELLENPDFSFSSALQFAVILTHSIMDLHESGIVHGDLHSENVRISVKEDVLELYLIDLDNFVAPDMPPPQCVGHANYMAPELRIAMKSRKPAIPTIESELYSLGVLLHEVLLLQHPTNGYDDTKEKFELATLHGWILDPILRNHKHNPDLGGYPPTILNSGLMRMFRNALSPIPSKRPNARAWKTELLEAYQQWAYQCDECGAPVIADIGNLKCSLCHTTFPHMVLVLKDCGQKFPLFSASTVLGRNHLGGSPMVSKQHVVFRRVGPLATMESVGRNGTFRWSGDSWIQLPDRKQLQVSNNDRLRFADAEAFIKVEK